MIINRLAAFSFDGVGGNPAGVVLLDSMPSAEKMQSIAREVGYSETVFAIGHAKISNWRIRYFSPESEVPFCGHATIALGALLAKEFGAGTYGLTLNDANITVEGSVNNGRYSASLTSPSTRFSALSKQQIESALEIFSYSHAQLDARYQPAFIHGGSNHFLFLLNSREHLSSMSYDLVEGKKFMQQHNLVTVMFAVEESPSHFHVRNAFASGGVYEDPATGAAAAAFAGFLRDHFDLRSGELTLIQGEDMGAKSMIVASFKPELLGSVRVSGSVYELN